MVDLSLVVLADVEKANVVVELWGVFSHAVLALTADVLSGLDKLWLGLKSFTSILQNIFSESFEFWFNLDPTRNEILAQRARNYKITSLRVVLTILSFIIPLIMGIYWYRANQISKKLSKGLIDPLKMWEKSPGIFSNSAYKSRKSIIPIITLANFKGGSGKSTIAANLSASFEDLGQRVLLIDFDPHGSLTSLMFDGDKLIINSYNNASGLLLREDQMMLGDDKKQGFQPLKIERLGKSEHDGHTSIFQADPQLAYAENDILMEALLGKRSKTTPVLEEYSLLTKLLQIPKMIFMFPIKLLLLPLALLKKIWRFISKDKRDVRFNAFHYLNESQISDKYDIVIIDTAAHLSPAFINGLCAATHLLVPTPLNEISVQVTQESLRTFGRLKNKLKLDFTTIGVLPSMTKDITSVNGKDLVLREKKIATSITEDKRFGNVEFLRDERIARKPKLAESNDKLAYVDDDEIRQQFLVLVQAISSTFSQSQKEREDKKELEKNRIKELHSVQSRISEKEKIKRQARALQQVSGVKASVTRTLAKEAIG